LSSTSPRTTQYAQHIVFFGLNPSPDRLQNRLKIIHGGTIASLVDLGGSLAVASKGLYATGVSTDLTGTFQHLTSS
jgi:acyl-coenzyme A thioesterase 13